MEYDEALKTGLLGGRAQQKLFNGYTWIRHGGGGWVGAWEGGGSGATEGRNYVDIHGVCMRLKSNIGERDFEFHPKTSTCPRLWSVSFRDGSRPCNLGDIRRTLASMTNRTSTAARRARRPSRDLAALPNQVAVMNFRSRSVLLKNGEAQTYL